MVAPAPVIGVVHFVTGGGSGATRVALDLALAQKKDRSLSPHLILRDKGRPLPAIMQNQIDQSGLSVSWVKNQWPRMRVIHQITALCKQMNPTAFFAHGYSEHLWGRQAALAAKVPWVIHVEHNIEHYWPWRLFTARRLAQHTDATVGVSTAVVENINRLGLGGKRVFVIHNGVEVNRFHCDKPLLQRADDILVPARFASKKDQPTLIRAAKQLVDRGWLGQLIFAGGGKERHRRYCESLVKKLGLCDRVLFLGSVDDLPKWFANCRVVALASWQEGLPLVLAEAMAAGCAVVASATPGTTDIVRDGENGWLFSQGAAESAAKVLWLALTDNQEAECRAERGRIDALSQFSLEQMAMQYRKLLDQLLNR